MENRHGQNFAAGIAAQNAAANPVFDPSPRPSLSARAISELDAAYDIATRLRCLLDRVRPPVPAPVSSGAQSDAAISNLQAIMEHMADAHTSARDLLGEIESRIG